MLEKITIRSYLEQDARALADIFYNTIHKVNIQDYTEEQVDAWAPKSSLELEGWLKKWANLNPIVAVVEDKIAGFTEFDHKTGYIDCFYCHHDFIGCGVGTAMLSTIEQQAKQHNTGRIYANVSTTARPFFTSKGFILVKEQIIERRGVTLNNNVMEKYIN